MLCTKSRVSNTNKLTWESSLLDLSKTSRIPKNLQKLYDYGILTVRDLLWIAPLHVQKKPSLKSFDHLHIGELFLGKAKLINLKLTPAYGRKGKSKVQLFNVQAVIKDLLSENYLTLKWFNAYPNIKKQLEELDEFSFMAEVSDFKGTLQAINPKLNPDNESEDILIKYPTVNTVSGRFIKTYIDRIPQSLWTQTLYPKLENLLQSLKRDSLNTSFKMLHAKSDFEKEAYKKEKNNIIYLEFLLDQIKVVSRKRKNKKLQARKFNISKERLIQFEKLFPYELTVDQVKVTHEIINDLNTGHPMMRILQGDVGSGKTTVAIITALSILDKGSQVAIMSPTEALALQHYREFGRYIGKEYNISLLVGSQSLSKKKEIYDELLQGKIDLIIGTHSLFQESVVFKDLQLAIIDEQHKFGVEQRQKLVSKGKSVHTLIMSATPIPRTLQLARYGDLEISTIKSMPSNRKGIKTRIVEGSNMENFLKFIYTRITLNEQIYIVTPAIEDSQMDINNLKDISIYFKKLFPKLEIGEVHGKVSSEGKRDILKSFSDKKLNILIATSVIEVGIDNPNATVMAIYNPERFGLSSLHQLRGRVGRGEKPGFCFLIADKELNLESIERLRILEQTHDGFKIAEADLKNRGQGDLFGKNQSGISNSKRIANIIDHFHIFEQVTKEVDTFAQSNPKLIDEIIDHVLNDAKVSYTI